MWQDIAKCVPQPGQRVLVWDEVYSQHQIAYYGRDGLFKERNDGKERAVVCIWWMALPDQPGGA